MVEQDSRAEWWDSMEERCATERRKGRWSEVTVSMGVEVSTEGGGTDLDWGMDSGEPKSHTPKF